MMHQNLKIIISFATAIMLLICAFGVSNAVLGVSGVTEVKVYQNDTLTKEENFNDVKKGWEKAISYANSSNQVSITLGDNWSHDDCLKIPENSNVTLDLNGYYIHRTRNREYVSDGEVFYVSKGATLTIKDSRPYSKGYDGVEGGVITGGASSDTAGGIHLAENSSLYMNGGTIYECTSQYNGGGICANEGSENIELRNSRIYFCQAADSSDNCYGGGMYIEDNKKTVIEDSTIDSCYCEDDGGAIYFENLGKTLYMHNAIFSANRANEQGGAIYIGSMSGDATTDVKAVNSFFVNNTSVDEGGAVYVNGRDKKNENPVLFTGCVFKKNISEDEGGAIYVNDRYVAVTDCSVIENKSKKEGGGIYVDSYYDLSVKGSVIIRDNESEDTRHNNLCLQEGVASTARVYSGGLYRNSYIVVSTTDDETHFSKNITEYQARYFHAEDGDLSFEKKDTVSTPLYASIFGTGSAFVITGIIALGIAAIAIAIIVKKKGEKKND